MQKKLMAVAVAGALAAPAVALAQTSTVQIGGSLTVFYYSHDPNNSNVGKRTDILEPSEPQIFIRGEEKVGGGMSVWFQCTSSFDGFIGGADHAFGWCARNSGIGIKGSFGNIWVGNWDIPNKLVFNRARQWWGGTNSLTGGTARLLMNGSASGENNGNGIAAPAAGAESTGAASFFRRHSETWFYHSPVWSGFQVQAAISAGDERTGIPDAAAVSLDPRLWTVALHYSNGPLYLGAGYERHQDYNPASLAQGVGAGLYSGGDDTNWTLVAGYRFGPVSIRGLYTRTEYEPSNGTDLEVDGWAFYGDWNVAGPHTLRFQYARVDDPSGSFAASVGHFRTPAAAGGLGTGGRVWGVAYSYALSKRSELSLVYTRVSSDAGAAYALGKVAGSLGQSQTSAGAVIKHRF